MDAFTIGVVADTHVPDRAPGLHPHLMAVFRKRAVQAILHAGDVCVPAVLAELETIAPVYAVRGNRDVFYLRHLPARLELTFNGVAVGLLHGHGSLHNYLVDRIRYAVRGLELRHFQIRVRRSFPSCQVIVYGHIHHPVQRWIDGQLLFNPGSACCPEHSRRPPSAGLVTFDGSGGIQEEIFDLN
jgi:putative phosphoesterase